MKQIKPEIVDEGDVFGEVLEATVDQENLGYMFDIVSSQIYSNPIESIVREITSNCFDSHIEAEVDKEVKIKLHYNDSGEYISFQDFGVGISPERMKKTYSKWFSSTKRDTNGQIGMFGLGSKSPLSYTDAFYVTTIFEGTKYEYMVYKGEKAPKIELINSESTALGNGTLVSIDVSNIYDFIKACKNQLAYFDNVYFEGCYSLNSVETYSLKNRYKIIEGDNFKYRPDANFRYLHICIGKVYYKLDFEKLGIPTIEVPIALKFEIGDLIITPERENIRYITFERIDEDGNTSEVDTKKVILDKIKLVRKELEERRQEFYKPTSNLKEWIDSYNVEDIIKFVDDESCEYELNFKDFRYIEWDNLTDKELEEKEKEKTFRRLTFFENSTLDEAFNISPSFLLSTFSVVGTLNEAKNYKKLTSLKLKEIIRRDSYLVFLNKGQKLDVTLNRYHNYVAEKQGKSLYFIKYSEASPKSLIYKAKKLSNFSRLSLNYIGHNFLSFVKEIRSINNNIKASCFIHYDTDIDPIWLAEYQLNKRINYTKNFIINHIRGDVKKDWKISFTNNEEFNNYFSRYAYIIYGDVENEEILKSFSKVFSFNSSNYCFIYTAKSNYKYFNDSDKFLTIQKFMETNKKELSDIAILLKEEVDKVSFIPTTYSNYNFYTFYDLCPLLFSDYHREVEKINKDIETFKISAVSNDFKTLILESMNDDILNNHSQKSILTKLKNKLNKIQFLKYINVEKDSDNNLQLYEICRELAIIFLKLSIKVSPEWYKCSKHEMFLLKESIKELDYRLQDINSTIEILDDYYYKRKLKSKKDKILNNLENLNFFYNYQKQL